VSSASANLVESALKAYERWAPLYPPVAHNPLMRAEERAMRSAWPDVRDRRALDLACGSGRYSRLLAESGAADIVALDFCLPMLRQVVTGHKVCGSMTRLPFHEGAFRAVISGLAIGHADSLQPWMTEVTRVLEVGGVLLYSDFHPQAARAGLTRSFKDENGRTRTVPHHPYDVLSQLEAAREARLNIERVSEIRVGRELCEPFPGSERFYREFAGLPIILIVRARK
jgi:ubiquinone/menaquinone biosynthesis C-methylase UbiE